MFSKYWEAGKETVSLFNKNKSIQVWSFFIPMRMSFKITDLSVISETLKWLIELLRGNP